MKQEPCEVAASIDSLPDNCTFQHHFGVLLQELERRFDRSRQEEYESEKELRGNERLWKEMQLTRIAAVL
jgi:hypothetical protein